jgi:hypothetical protein
MPSDIAAISLKRFRTLSQLIPSDEATCSVSSRSPDSSSDAISVGWERLAVLAQQTTSPVWLWPLIGQYWAKFADSDTSGL